MGRNRRQRYAPSTVDIDQISPELKRIVDIELYRILKASSLARAEQEELEACAWMGFFEAKKHFDPRQGVEFSTFARRRVRGAIFDGLADISPLGRKAIRAVKRTLKGLEVEQFESSLSSAKTELKEPNSTGYDDQSMASHAVPSFLESYRALYFQAVNLWTQTLSQALIKDPAIPHESSDDTEQASRLLSQGFDQLSDAEQQVLISVYDLRRIGDNASAYAQRMNLHRSTVSRRHANALSKLRKSIKENKNR